MTKGKRHRLIDSAESKETKLKGNRYSNISQLRGYNNWFSVDSVGNSGGDRNSKLFHARATARRKKNFISSLIDRNGRVQDSDEGLASTVRDFYSALFLSSRPSTQDTLEASKAIRVEVGKVISKITQK
ncbi:hypothetical protein Ddye_027648 [Dipteronia dyeriana]|uniref:Uncharacterized protein n=1 Tax=Dipteronia dyeriana TaxID=168575 RepID=A0AAD9TPY4_9ROSI|nr:hypothetical protein Ddye_027648 [Dipteronia dyeriana]